MKTRNIITLFMAILVCQLAGFIGSLFTAPAIPTWYLSLKKPPFTPPDWVFSPVWIFLYFLMGISLYMVLTQDLRNPFFAFSEIIILWLAIACTIRQFSKISRYASYLLIPYLVWVTFALFLNFSIWRLNV